MSAAPAPALAPAVTSRPQARPAMGQAENMVIAGPIAPALAGVAFIGPGLHGLTLQHEAAGIAQDASESPPLPITLPIHATPQTKPTGSPRRRSPSRAGAGLLSRHEAAERLGISLRTLNGWLAQDRLGRVKYPGCSRVFIQTIELDKLIAKSAERPASRRRRAARREEAA